MNYQIGKTSALVLTLSGVLKDILLVVASMVIFHDPVTPLQALGYGIALMGLVYYKLGAEGVRNFLANTRQSLRGVGIRRLVLIIVISAVVYLGFLQYTQKASVFSPALLSGIGSKN
jgi:hypothetical protein